MSSIKDFELAQRIHIATVTLQAEIVTLRNAAVLATELAEKAESRIAALEAERDAMRDLLRRLRQWDMLSEGNTPRLADRDYWCEQIDAAIDAAKGKP